MRKQQSFAIQSFLVVLIGNAILLGVVYFLLAPYVPRNPLVTALGIGAGLTFLLWLLLLWIGRRAIAGAVTSTLASIPAQPLPAAPKPKSAPALKTEVEPATPQPTASPTASAVQMLAILQREGRLIDFLQEDLSGFEDGQIGAAVRSIHQGCKQALAEHLTLEPVYSQSEGSQVTVEPGFSAYAVRLSGNVTGNPPFSGSLRHRGWRVTKIDLPDQNPEQAAAMVLAAAEVEVSG